MLTWRHFRISRSAYIFRTNYIAALKGNWTQTKAFLTTKTIGYWPLLSGVDVIANSQGATVAALGSSTTDDDGSSKDANRRWPDVLADRLQKECKFVLNLACFNFSKYYVKY
jgi:hypothetical protein